MTIMQIVLFFTLWVCTGGLITSVNSCGHPGNMINGHFRLVNGTDYVVGAKVKYTCNEGFHIASERDIRICTTYGWSDHIPLCKAVTCPFEGTENDVIVSGLSEYTAGVPYGYMLLFECSSSSKKLNNKLEVYCGADGKWSHPFPTCNVLSQICTRPPEVSNGQMISPQKTSYDNGEKVEYICQKTFYFKGQNYVQCLEGTWTTTPLCSPTICGQPPVVTNADIEGWTKSSYESGDRVTYRCQKFYIVEGSNTITCARGEWTTPPKCLEPCTVTLDDMKRNNLRLKHRESELVFIKHDEPAEFACIDGTSLKGNNPLRLKCNDGKVNLPVCG